jgi:hypothetical protein
MVVSHAAGGQVRALEHGPDMTAFHCTDKIDNYEYVVQYIEQ